ncbi:insulinase family protein [Marinomonas posidonica]|uniref:insulinase family protein n=1 Tax=Marinomonas posidonica TaxID=936476 RepID=UPI0037357564
MIKAVTILCCLFGLSFSCALFSAQETIPSEIQADAAQAAKPILAEGNTSPAQPKPSSHASTDTPKNNTQVQETTSTKINTPATNQGTDLTTKHHLIGEIEEMPHKSRTDQSQYHFITLPNGLKVTLVSDPQAEKFAASLSVKIGSFQDPNQQLGLAHLLEHMLFLGTEKYPESGNYQSFIHNHAGTHNAYTSTDNTNYFFDVKPSAYEGALDRFSQFFITPLFSESLTQREKNAVDAEYKAKIKTDSRRNNQALKTLINSEHPYSRFTVGNLKTLKDRPNQSLREQVMNLYQQHYYAENMALVLVANLGHEQLADLAQRYFSDIPQHPSKPYQDQTYPNLIKSDLASPKLQFVHSLSDRNSIRFYYQIPAQGQNYKTQPTRYLSYILGNENKQSLYSTLKSEDLITSISASTSNDYGHNAFFTVNINLTNKGMKHINDVAKHFFATISLLKSSPVNPMYLDEGLKLSRLMFNNQSYVTPIRLARSLSSRMLKVNMTDLLGSYRIENTAAQEDVQALLKQLTPNNLLVQIASQQTFPEDWAAEPSNWQEEPWYQTQYSNHHFSQTFLDMMTLAVKSTFVSLPQKNLFIPNSLELIEEVEDKPTVVFEELGFRFWHKSDPSFNKPTAMNFLAIRFDHAGDTAKHMLANRLWTRLFNASISEATYSPYVAGLGYSFYPHVNGVTLRTNGYSDKQGEYLTWLVDQLFLYRPNREKFEQAKQQLAKDFKNQQNRQAFRIANTAFNTLITKNSYTTDALEQALQDLSFSDYESFIKQARERFNIVGYSTGNITKANSQKLADTLYQRFIGRLIEHTPVKIETKRILPQQKLHAAFASSSDDSVILYTLIDTSHQGQDESPTTIAQKCYFTLLNTLLKSAFYQELRTEKQMGYIVGTQNLSIRNTPILGLLVQSPNKDNLTLIRAIERFLDEQEIKLKNLTDEAFQAAKNAMLANAIREAKNLSENALKEWPQIAKSEPNFKTKEEWIDVIEQIKKEDFVRFVKQKIESGQTTRIIVHNKAFPDELTGDQAIWQETSATNQSL